MCNTDYPCWLQMSKECNSSDCNPSMCIKLTKLNYLYNQANIPLALRTHRNLVCDADGTDEVEFTRLKKAEDSMLQFVQTGTNLYLYSVQSGNGKTSWSLRLMQSYFNNIWKKCSMQKCYGLFINVPHFLQELKVNLSTRSAYIQHIKKYIHDCDLVIWDDISTKTGTTFEIDQLLSIIDYRLNAGKSNIYTSNISPEKLVDYLDSRLASRIANQSICIELRGGDKRGWEV